MERLCRCYKHTARNCGDGFKAVLPRLLPQIVAWFEVKPHSVSYTHLTLPTTD